jgi:hypothetical protein
MKQYVLAGMAGLLLVCTSSVVSAGSQDPMVGGSAMYPTKNIVENALNTTPRSLQP